MKYYVVEVAEGDSKIKGVSVGTHDSVRSAKASFHGKLSTAMKSDLYTRDLVLVIDEDGNVMERDKYVAEVTEE